MIQQFREAPSAYIFFVHELIKTFMDVKSSSKILSKIFDKLKDHFWSSPEEKEKMPQQLRPNFESVVNIETEHMALFFHNVLRETAIYKIMKSAQQTLEDDKLTLKEYRVFITIIEIYRKVYSYCKM